MGELINEYIKKCIKRIQRLPRTLKWLVIIALAAGALIACRIGLLGAQPQRTLFLLLPYRLPWDVQTLITCRFEILEAQVWTPGKLGGSYTDGEVVRFSFNTSVPSWLILLSVDSNGHRIFYPRPGNQEAFWYEPSDNGTEIQFRLDQTKGPEFYIVVGAQYPFHFSDIRTYVERFLINKGLRGPDLSTVLPLPNTYDQCVVAFDHR